MRNGKFLVSLHSWQRGSNSPFLWRPSYVTYPKLCPTPSPPLPCHLQPPPQLFFLLSCFFGWMGDHATFDVLFYLIIIWIYTCQALVPEGPWCVFYAKMSQVYRGLTYVLFLLVLWFDITNTQTHIQHTQRPVDWHTHINEYLHHLLCAQSSYLYYIKWLNFVLKEN